MSKNKKPKQRNYVVKQMIESGRKAGYHTDKAKESEKYLCREKVDPEDYEDELEDDCDY